MRTLEAFANKRKPLALEKNQRKKVNSLCFSDIHGKSTAKKTSTFYRRPNIRSERRAYNITPRRTLSKHSTLSFDISPANAGVSRCIQKVASVAYKPCTSRFARLFHAWYIICSTSRLQRYPPRLPPPIT